ncbi:serine/threonine-protein kinase/endoribonuclease IRE1-like [Xenia sp. Carnegie-2017]|uniref:serine/threonine-protein kinase/endoribonuclease IRE1-like n=1 Tax=Xenia sp. Carnegie-2017 TaxID=2897299 RepID=UPI001F04CB44|nr:serine/threonine-protein kinase/endoribonuclease IRE1-like [Xenia sp. Carnegie-2017]
MSSRKLKSLSVQEWRLQEWEYLGHSVQHRSLLSELCYPGADIKHVGNVRVIFSEKFKLGEGSNETRVYLGLTNNGYGKAVKQMRRDNYLQPAQHEKKILNEFNAKKSKYVVNYYFLEEDTGTEYVYLILDLCEESLEKFVNDSTLHYLQKALPDILRQILNGLDDLHRGPDSILHRDLKPSNVLRDVDGNFLIADFGISRMLKNGSKTYKSNFNRGTEYWNAPESYCEDEDSNEARNEDPNKARYKKESDVYNAGMGAYYVATKGKHPFGTKRFRLDNMLNGKPVGLAEIKDATLKDLLSWMLKLQPEERPSANEALKHPFLLSDDEKFHFLCKVGDLLSIKRNDPQSSIVQQINIESSNWKSQIDNDVYEYLVNGRKYGSSWTECLKLIQNIGMHWNDRPRPLPQPEPYYKIGDYRAYFVKTFPTLPVWIHAAVRSNNELKELSELTIDGRKKSVGPEHLATTLSKCRKVNRYSKENDLSFEKPILIRPRRRYRVGTESLNSIETNSDDTVDGKPSSNLQAHTEKRKEINKILLEFARKISDKWKNLAIFLNVKDAKIKDIELNHRDVVWQGFEMLKFWFESRENKQLWYEELAAALRKIEKYNLAEDVLQKELSELAIDGRKKSIGPEHVATTLSMLDNVYRYSKENDKIKPLPIIRKPILQKPPAPRYRVVIESSNSIERNSDDTANAKPSSNLQARTKKRKAQTRTHGYEEIFE